MGASPAFRAVAAASGREPTQEDLAVVLKFTGLLICSRIEISTLFEPCGFREEALSSLQQEWRLDPRKYSRERSETPGCLP